MKFSILTPTRDRPEWIGRAVASVQAQTYGDWEQIVYDVGDTPLDPATLPDDPRVRYVRGECRGPAADFQACLDLATGEIVTPLSDDDRLPRHALDTVSREMAHEWGQHPRGPHVDGAACSTCGMVASSAEIARHEWSTLVLCPAKEMLNGRTVIVNPDGDPVAFRGGTTPHLDDTRHGAYMLGGAVYWRKTLTDRIGGFDSQFDGAADFDLYSRMIRHTTPVLTPDILYLYSDHPGTDTRVNMERQRDASRRIAASL